MLDNLIKNIYIPSIDAKDLYVANNYIEKDNIGYNLYDVNNNFNFNKFINTLDYSIESMKLREIYYKVFRNTDFTITQNNKEYTNKIINVTFEYSNKNFNRVGKNLFIRFGYNIKNLKFVDNICIVDNQLIGIKTDVEVKESVDKLILGEHFYFDENENVYKSKNNFKTINTVANLRAILYKQGFICNGVKYIRMKRSSGSSRVGKCLFIDERLYNRLHKWQLCGLKIKENQEIDLAAFESYISLTLSSIIDTVEINKENILVIDDYESIFQNSVIATKIINGSLKTQEETVDITNSIWDGQSLLDVSMFGKYRHRGMLLLRNRFFKTASFNTNIQEWFKDNGISEVSQLNGFTLAKKIEDIKLITTPNSIKYLKFGTIEQWLSNLESTFGVVKYEKPTYNFNGRMVQIHYQLLNTLQMTYDEVCDLVKPSLDYLNMIKHDPSVLQYYIAYPNNEFGEDSLNNKNDIVFKMLGVNSDFYKTKMCRDFITNIIKSYYKNLRCGHILIHGNYATLFGNPVEMLEQAIGTFKGESQIGIGNIVNKNFEHNETVLGCRSPHVTMGNILLSNNTHNEQINKYFNLTKEIVCINSIKENILERLSSADFDSDQMIQTNNKLLIESAKKNYNNFKVPTNMVEAKKICRKYNDDEKTDLDIKTSVNLIGEIINLSQELNSLFWDNIAKGQTFEDNKKLYYDICQLDVMSCIEIDSAKKEFDVDNKKEMQKIKDRYHVRDEDTNKIIKPKFFEMLYNIKGYDKLSNKNGYNKHYKYYNTSMDYLQRAIRSYSLDRYYKSDTLKFSDIINKADYNKSRINKNQIDNIVGVIRDFNKYSIKLWNNEKIENYIKFDLYNTEKNKVIEYIGNIRTNRDTIIRLLELIDDDKYKDIARLLFNTLFAVGNKDFFEVIKLSKEYIPKLKESKCGSIQIYDFMFSKLTKN